MGCGAGLDALIAAQRVGPEGKVIAATRDLARISEKHLGHRYDSKQISHIVGRATTELEAWRRRSLQGQRYKFLYVDGANFLVRIDGHVNRQSFCAV